MKRELTPEQAMEKFIQCGWDGRSEMTYALLLKIWKKLDKK